MIAISQFTTAFQKFGKGREWELSDRIYLMALAHTIGLHGLYLILSGQMPLPYVIVGFLAFFAAGLSGTAGGHRLWAHRAYKAKLPLRMGLMVAHTLLGQESVYSWARNHRLHHKFCETNADPYTVSRGMFFAHIGWTLVKEHPSVKEHEKKIDLSDLLDDPVVAIQHKYFRIFDLILCYAIPILIPYYLWGPSLYECVALNFARYLLSHHITGLGNSVAHFWNRKPYESKISPADITWLSLVLIGEGWHNFHHVFPWDYRGTDVGPYLLNFTTAFLDLMAKLGLVYDRKTVPDYVIRKRAARTGDSSHPHVAQIKVEHNDQAVEDVWDETQLKCSKKSYNCVNENICADKFTVKEIGPGPWGWGDKDISQDCIQDTLIIR